MAAERTPRAEAIAGERRRRKDDTLNRIAGQKLAIPAEFASDTTHSYRWINDKEDRVYDLTVNDDYDIVTRSGVEASDDDRVRRPVGQDENGKPLYAVLVRKPIEFVKEDRAERDKALREGENQLKRKAPPAEGLSADHAYTSETNTIKAGGYTP